MENERRSVGGKRSRQNLANSLAVFANTSALPDFFLSTRPKYFHLRVFPAPALAP